MLIYSRLQQLIVSNISVCNDDQIRNGSNPSEGIVQGCYDNEQNRLNAMVVYTDLNLNCRRPSNVHKVAMYSSDNSVVALCKAYIGPGPGSILLDHAIRVQNSLPSDDAGVSCRGKVMMTKVRS